jgi:hypothetical protein
LKTIRNKAAASEVLALVLAGMCWASAIAQPVGSFADHLLIRVATPLAVAYHPRAGRLFVATQAPATAARLSDGSKALDVQHVQGSPGSTILRLRVDAQRERLWVLEVGAVHVIDLVARERIARIELTNWMYTADATNCLPDLQLDPGGSAIVTDNVQPKLWRIDPDHFSFREYRPTFDTQDTIDAGFTALNVREDGSIVAAMAAPGSLWRIDRALSRAVQIPLNVRIHGACAFENAVAPDNATIFVAAAARGRLDVYRIDLPRLAASANVGASGALASLAPAGLVSIDGVPHLAILRGAPSADRRSLSREGQLLLTPVRGHRTGRRPPI